MIINESNIYSYNFPPIALALRDSIIKTGRMSSALVRGFAKKRVICETKSYSSPYWRDIYISERYKLVAKRAAFNSLDFVLDFLCPTIFDKDCNGRDFQIQPLCEIKPKTETLGIKKEFKKLAPNLDCNGGNIGFLNGIATLIDW
jgi:hypothetical protein